MKIKLLFFALLSIPVIAQDSLQYNLAEIKVAANLTESGLRSTARNVMIIDQKDISMSPVRTLDGILKYALNVDVRSRSPLGVQGDISIRGGNFDQTLILVDGIKMNDPQTGHHSLNLPVPLEMIDRIEILQGGASRVFGPSAFSGLINIITKKEVQENVILEAATGQFGLQNYSAFGGVKVKSISGFASVSSLTSDGYAYNTAFDRKTAYGKIDLNQKNGYLTLQGGALQNDFGASNFYHPKFNNQYEETGSTFFAVTKGQQFSNKLSGTLNLSVRKHNDLYDFNNYRDSLIQNVNFHETEVLDAEWKMRYLSKIGASAIGVEWRKESVLSNRLGDTAKEAVQVKDYPEVFYNKYKSRTNFSAYLEHQTKWEKLMISAGTLINFNSQFGTELYPGVDVSYFLSDNHSVYSSLNRSLRFPTFTELYLNTSTVKADPNLLPEKAINYELGYKFFQKGFSLTSSVFYKKTTDAIDKIKRPELEVPTMENIDNINMAGIEFGAQFNFAQHVSKSDLFLQKLQLNYAYLTADRREEGFQSFYTLNYLSQNAGLGSFFRLTKGLNAVVWYTFKQREGSYQWDSTSPILDYRPVNLLDVRIDYRYRFAEVYLDLKNLLDYSYYEFGFVEQPGRWMSVGIKLKF
ncbi:MAG: TonB-dependent receptor [Cytophagales bacterium]|nr:TonB-dependent receptor [Cytophagales bacterium]